jgi:DNA-3-methyladenine glycosylase II
MRDWAHVTTARARPAGSRPPGRHLAGRGRNPGRAGPGHAPAGCRGRAPHVRPPAETHFAALVRSVLYQQLAGPAAAAIHGRLIAALNGQVIPERVLALPADTLRSVGLSGSKAASLRDLAAKVLDGTVVLDPPGLRAESDAEVVARLTTVRGIGKWTAEMFLMFQLRRLDVWPTGDLGVRKGFGLAWEIPTPTAKQLEPLGDPYRPYRSVVAWYCWRAAEIYGGTADSALTR